MKRHPYLPYYLDVMGNLYDMEQRPVKASATQAYVYKGRHAVHRMMAETYLVNPFGKPYVNHKNGDKQDNRVTNLEWCTHLENMQHYHRIKGHKDTHKDEKYKQWTDKSFWGSPYSSIRHADDPMY